MLRESSFRRRELKLFYSIWAHVMVEPVEKIGSFIYVAEFSDTSPFTTTHALSMQKADGSSVLLIYYVMLALRLTILYVIFYNFI